MKHLLLTFAGLSILLPAFALGSTEVAQSKATDSPGAGVQVPEALKRKFKPAAIIKKPVVVKRFF